MAINTPQQPLSISISRTSDGQHEYLQIMSADQFSLNIVLISPKFTITDKRPKGKS